MKDYAKPLAGAIGGGIAGYLLFVFLMKQGFYAGMLPGAAVGMGGGWLLKSRSIGFGAVCGVLGLALSIYSAWYAGPFIADDSLPYFITHLHHANNGTLIMLVIGSLMAFWFGQGR